MFEPEEYRGQETAWCPGCGNFPIREALMETLAEMEIPPHQVVLSSGIGQAAKMPHYVRVNGFNGLHGRALPPALAIRVANPQLQVIVESGDGDTYGEGGNHFLHNIRRNPNLAHFVHNNQIYGLTKGQASPTSELGMETKVQSQGVFVPPLSPLAVALVAGAGFVARAFAGDRQHLQEMMKAALQFPGYALVDILQPCVSFNRVNTYQWYKERVYRVEHHDPENWSEALSLALQWGDSIPLGVFYRVPRPTFEDNLPAPAEGGLAFRPFNPEEIAAVQNEFA